GVRRGGRARAVVGRVGALGAGASQAEAADLAGDRAGVVGLVAEGGVGRVVDRGRAVLDQRAGAAAGLVDGERFAAAVAARVVAVAAVDGDREGVVEGQGRAQGGGGVRGDRGDRLGGGRGGCAGAVLGRVEAVGHAASGAQGGDVAGVRACVVGLVAEGGVGRVVDRGRAVLDQRAGAAAGLVDGERLAAAVAARVVAVAAVDGLVRAEERRVGNA